MHNVFVGVQEKTKYYILPSTSFVRREYSELQVVSPGEEFGRNDTAKLGYFIVKVFTGRHEIVQSEHMEKLVSIRKRRTRTYYC